MICQNGATYCATGVDLRRSACGRPMDFQGDSLLPGFLLAAVWEGDTRTYTSPGTSSLAKLPDRGCQDRTAVYTARELGSLHYSQPISPRKDGTLVAAHSAEPRAQHSARKLDKSDNSHKRTRSLTTPVFRTRRTRRRKHRTRGLLRPIRGS
jgi:hypothetical protein